MIKVKLTFPYSWPIIKQTPGRSGIWGDCKFYINEDIDECDFWVVFDGLSTTERVKCPRENTLLITAEPPSIKTYAPDFVNQFAAVLTCHTLDHRNVINSQQGLNWMVGGKYIEHSHSWEEHHTKDYDELSSITTYNKTKLLSLISSNKSITSGHRERVLFIEALRNHFGNELEVFGVGFKEVKDKWDAIYPYKYTIVIENSICKDYWTEKISDAFLGGAYPIYHGCPNITDYFPPTAFSHISSIGECISVIETLIHDNEYERRIENILYAKELILNRFNLMAVINEYCKLNLSIQPKVNLTLLPEWKFVRQNFVRRAGRFLRNLLQNEQR